MFIAERGRGSATSVVLSEQTETTTLQGTKIPTNTRTALGAGR